MNNGIFAHDVYGKAGFEERLPKSLSGPPNVVNMPYHYPPGGEWSINAKNWTIAIDTTLENNTNVIMVFNISGSTLIDIDWGDGYFESFLIGASRDISHSYSCHGTYTIQLYFTIIGSSGVGSDTVTNKVKWIKCFSLGDKGIPRCRQMFAGCSNLVEMPKTIPSGCGTGFDGMRAMFQNATKFNGDISLWDVSSCISMQQMFVNATVFNQPINNWNVSSVTNMSSMFSYCSSFNQDLSSWNTSKVTTIASMFDNANSFNNGGSSGINNWNTSSVTSFRRTFALTGFNQPIGNWNTASGTDMTQMFSNDLVFNQDIGNWNVSGVTNMTEMFGTARAFNNGGSSSISGWNTSNVTTMNGMFINGNAFNQPLNNWNVRKVTTFSNMFLNALSFNSSLSGWALGADTSGTTCVGMFFSASSFNQNIGSWDVSKITNMNTMFTSTTLFNNGGSPSISGWNTSNVTDMGSMFWNNRDFNQPIGNWDVSKVTNMSNMFMNNTFFNQPIGSWNVSKVTSFQNMLRCRDFQQNISNWNLAGINVNTGLDGFMSEKTGANSYSTANYDALLIGWNNNKLASANGVANWRTDLRPNFGGARYTGGGAAATARAALVSYGWTITDGGVA